MNTHPDSTMTLVTSVCWFLAGLCITFSFGMAQSPEVKKETIEGYLRRRNVTFVVRGKVVDQDGGPLRNVTVEISRMTKTGPLAKTETKEVRTVDAAFDMQFQDNCAVYLSFRLAGYHSGNLSFSSLEREGVRIDGRTRIYEEITVALQKIGKLTHLHEYGPVLTWSADGESRAWDVSKVGPTRAEGRMLNFTGAPAPDIPCVYVHIVPSEVPIAPATPMGGTEEISPRDGIVRIVIQDGQGGGFVRAQTKARNVMGAVLDVTTAPAEGYSPTLDISADEIAAMRRGGEKVNPLFYFKLNGLYGKGFVNHLIYRTGVGIMSCSLFFCVQPDGSTNVETTNW